ncbi:MAG: haloacid dehalogenase type II [Rhodospirillaceae bacterium]|nr:haloacid dehalogenase type II [Rhodospirillaceae bacterium]
MPAEGRSQPAACVFDAYGTLFDIGTPAEVCREALGEAAASLTALWRRKQLEYTWLRSLMGKYADFSQVTADALDVALAALAIEPGRLRQRLLDSYLALDVYPEVPLALQRLRERGIALLILSNGTRPMLDAICARNNIAALFDDILSVDAVGIFKPHPSVYKLATTRLGVAPGDIAFVSSNGWDIAGGSAFGFRTIWVNRAGHPVERLPGTPAAEIADLSHLPDLLHSGAST